MAISATLQIGVSGGVTGFLAQNLKDIYTVLSLDYTLERTCDKSGRPSGPASITFIKVTIRAAKQMGAPFHEWINGEDTQMDGVIKIYDSSGLFVSSTMQDSLGIDPVLDLDKAFDTPSDMMTGAMTQAMDNASDYSTDDIYDEMSRKDLLALAKEKGVEVKSGDSDDEIREKIRIQNEYESNFEKLKEDYKKAELKDDDTLKKFLNEHPCVKWPDDLTKAKTKLKELDKKDFDDIDLKNEIKDYTKKQHKKATVKEKALAPAYRYADNLKEQTASTSKGIVKEAAKRTLECARSIAFEKAYCVSLREHFVNRPNFEGALNSAYPWTLEIGIKPKKVTVTGEQIGPKAFGGEVGIELY